MFAIGSSLREARLRQGLGFPEIEQATKIRAKHLKALEDEQFELLPAQTYVKGFLRTYAEYLGLDGQLYVDEFNSRYAIGEDDVQPIARTSVGGRRRVEARSILFALLGIAAVTALVIAAYQSTGSRDEAPPPNAADTQASQQQRRPPKKKRERPKPRPPARAKLVLTASNGPSWIEAHVGSATGFQLFEGTLEPGDTLPLPRVKRIWLRVGQPASLSWQLNGKRRPPPGSDVGNFVVTAKGIRTAPETA